MYVVIAAVVLGLLAALGVVHLFSRGDDGSPPATPSASTATQPSPSPSPRVVADQEVAAAPGLAITDLKARRRRLRDGSRLVNVRIGVAPQPGAKTGEVEIRVFFFDVTRDGELRPTGAEVTYEWLTPVRDWSDPSPKFLEATYLRPRRRRDAGERLGFGGYVVRVYSDGRLQDERGEPRQILAALRTGSASSGTASDPTAAMPPAIADASPAEELEESSSADLARSRPPESTRPPVASPTPSISTSTAPFGKPAPGKPGFIYSPHDEKFIIDVRGIPPGTEITDPNTGKLLRVP